MAGYKGLSALRAHLSSVLRPGPHGKVTPGVRRGPCPCRRSPCARTWRCPRTRRTPAGLPWDTWSSTGTRPGTQDKPPQRRDPRGSPRPGRPRRQEGGGTQEVRPCSSILELMPRIPLLPGRAQMTSGGFFSFPCFGFVVGDLGKL